MNSQLHNTSTKYSEKKYAISYAIHVAMIINCWLAVALNSFRIQLTWITYCVAEPFRGKGDFEKWHHDEKYGKIQIKNDKSAWINIILFQDIFINDWYENITLLKEQRKSWFN
jgi:hypothetical protein